MCGSAEKFYLTTQSRRSRQPGIGGEQEDVEPLGERDVAGVVDRQVVVEFPAPLQKPSM